MELSLAFFVVALHITVCVGYRPVIVMHGILSDAADQQQLVDMIKQAHQGTEVLNVDLYNDLDSIFVEMWKQVDGVYAKIKPFMNASKDGVNLVCFSQGGLLCRGILEKYPHNVHTFVSLSAPQAGQYGVTDYLKPLLPGFLKNITKEDLYKFFYTELFQKENTIAEYWRDPHHVEEYVKGNIFLAPLDNATGENDYRSNFLKIQQLVLIGGQDDGVITPWQSSQFAFYDSTDSVVPMQSQTYYSTDSFGLQTLDKAGKIKTYSIAGVHHTHWHTNQSVFTQAIEPWLD